MDEVCNILQVKEIPLDDLVECPFDPHHKIKGRRITGHITKCLKNHDGKFKVCPYNALHYVLPEYYSAHVFECPNKFEEKTNNEISQVNETTALQTTDSIIESLKFLDSNSLIKKIKNISNNINPFISENSYKGSLLLYMEQDPVEYFKKLTHANEKNKYSHTISQMELQQMFVTQPLDPDMDSFLKNLYI